MKWIWTIIVVVIIIMIIKHDKSNGHYDANWKKIRCKKCNSTDIEMLVCIEEDLNWQCNKCGYAWF